MKMVTQWFDDVVDTIHEPKTKTSFFLVVLLVLVMGAGSLYMLLNTTE